MTVTYENWVNEDWQDISKMFYTYDNNDYLINDLGQQWNNTTTSYINNHQVNYTNNSNGTIQQYIRQIWDADISSWTNQIRATYTYQGTANIEDFNNSIIITIYPNPTSDYINIQTNSTIKEVKIYDLNGRLKSEKTFNSENYNVDIRDLSSGFYLLQVYDENERITTKKILKQ